MIVERRPQVGKTKFGAGIMRQRTINEAKVGSTPRVASALAVDAGVTSGGL